MREIRRVALGGGKRLRPALVVAGLRTVSGSADIEPALTSAALAHYNDFGHTLIYLAHVRRLIDALGATVEKPLALAWVRSLTYATREDLLPDFQGYAAALDDWPKAAERAPAPAPSSAQF